MKRYILSIIALVLFATTFYAQEQTAAATNDSVPALTKKRTTQAKGSAPESALQYSGRTQLHPRLRCRAGRKRLMTFRMNPSDTTQLRSVVPMAIASCSTVASISSPNRNSSLRATVSVSSESSAIKIRKKTFTASAIIPIKITYEATVPANTGTAACKSTLVPFPTGQQQYLCRTSNRHQLRPLDGARQVLGGRTFVQRSRRYGQWL